jgi:hypothetical protein
MKNCRRLWLRRKYSLSAQLIPMAASTYPQRVWAVLKLSNQLIWLNLTGIFNETAAHLLKQPRMTLMFCSFEGKPLILCVYGRARAIHARDGEWTKWITLFSKYPWFAKNMHGHGDYAQTFCSFAVPSFDYQEDRKT